MRPQSVQKPYLVYCGYSQTLRQMPQNYLIAVKNMNRWVVDPDCSADSAIVGKIAELIVNFRTKYGSGTQLIEAFMEEEDGNVDT